MQYFSVSPREMASTFWRHRSLIYQLTKREVLGRYRGSVAGLGWSLLHPVLMLTIYTFVFARIFHARWPDLTNSQTTTDFALVLFVGLIVHGIFAECINKAPGLIVSNANYVKKVVFPLEILPCVAMGSAVFHGSMSVLIIVFAQLLQHQTLPWTAMTFPLVLLPLLCASMGTAWFLSALGVYIRDIVQVTGILTTVLLFISPVFFPVSAVPSSFQPWFNLNPLTFVIEAGRDSLIFGRVFDWGEWAWYLFASLVVAWAGFWWFQRTRRGFADVI